MPSVVAKILRVPLSSEFAEFHPLRAQVASKAFVFLLDRRLSSVIATAQEGRMPERICVGRPRILIGISEVVGESPGTAT